MMLEALMRVTKVMYCLFVAYWTALTPMAPMGRPGSAGSMRRPAPTSAELRQLAHTIARLAALVPRPHNAAVMKFKDEMSECITR
jgi:hypothetical protein